MPTCVRVRVCVCACLCCVCVLASSVDVWDDAVWHALAIFVPCRSVLCTALVIIPAFAVDEKSSKVNDVKVRQDAGKAAGKAPGESHEEVAKVVDVTGKAPPPRGNAH